MLQITRLGSPAGRQRRRQPHLKSKGRTVAFQNHMIVYVKKSIAKKALQILEKQLAL
jgi:hypothetical protein